MAQTPYRERPATEVVRYCLACGARAEPGSRCAGCGAEPADEEDTLSADDALPCPRCHQSLSGESLDGALVFRCATCLGCFLPARAWSAILDHVLAGVPVPMPTLLPLPPDRELPPGTLLATVRCPVCERVADRLVFGADSGIVIDVCARHGTWFDAAELVRVKQYVKLRQEIPPPNEEDRLLDLRRMAHRYADREARIPLLDRHARYRDRGLLDFVIDVLTTPIKLG